MQITGFSREITLIDYGITSDQEKFVSEICIPVRPEEELDGNQRKECLPGGGF